MFPPFGSVLNKYPFDTAKERSGSIEAQNKTASRGACLAGREKRVKTMCGFLRAFFVYGFFGVVYQWIKYDFDETPERIRRHTAEVILRAVKEQQGN